MPYPQSFIQELLNRNPIETVVSHYVDLKRAGRNLVGKCPFHSERSPSFTVFEDNFHCFGCSAGGNVITFIMRIENLDYRDAVQFLADRAGITVPNDGLYAYKKEKPRLTRERAFAMNKAAARIFYENLLSDKGEKAREYLEMRKLSTSTLRRFGIGFALDDFVYLTDRLKGQGYTVDEINANFLCGISQKNSRPFDMFRNRVMFPIIDTSGNIIAFGGRVMDDSKPKYLNSSDTVIFKKSKNLFALNFAKDVLLGNIKSELVNPGEIIICEGYMDVIAMHKAGFSNAVATLGTAITPEHARIISRYAKTAFVAYDSDEAGKKAADKALKLLSEVGVECRVLRIPDAKDPDEYINKYGSAAFAKLLTGSVGQTDYRINEILSKYDLKNPDDKLSALRECCNMLSDIASPIKRDIYIQRLSELTGIAKDSISRQAELSRKNRSKKLSSDMAKAAQNKMMHFDDKVNPDSLKFPAAAEIEERIIGILLLFPELYSKCEALAADDFITAFGRRVYEKLSELYSEEQTDISALNEFFNPDETARIYDMREKRKELTVNGIVTLNEQIKALKNERLKIDAKQHKVNSDNDLESFIEQLRKNKGIKTDK